MHRFAKFHKTSFQEHNSPGWVWEERLANWRPYKSWLNLKWKLKVKVKKRGSACDTTIKAFNATVEMCFLLLPFFPPLTEKTIVLGLLETAAANLQPELEAVGAETGEHSGSGPWGSAQEH